MYPAHSKNRVNIKHTTDWSFIQLKQSVYIILKYTASLIKHEKNMCRVNNVTISIVSILTRNHIIGSLEQERSETFQAKKVYDSPSIM